MPMQEAVAEVHIASHFLRQAVELIDHLLDFAQVDQFAGPAGESHRQFTVGQLAALRALQSFQFSLDHQHR